MNFFLLPRRSAQFQVKIHQRSTVKTKRGASITSNGLCLVNTCWILEIRFGAGRMIPNDIQKMLEIYEDLSKKLCFFLDVAILHSTQNSTFVHPTSQSNNTQFKHGHLTPYPTPYTCTTPFTEPWHTTQPISQIQLTQPTHMRKWCPKFIAVNSKCREAELVIIRLTSATTASVGRWRRGKRRTLVMLNFWKVCCSSLSLGDFKDMLMNKEDMTVAELKRFLQSHLGEKSSTKHKKWCVHRPTTVGCAGTTAPGLWAG